MKTVSTCILETAKYPRKFGIDVNAGLSHLPHCLAGRATAVLESSVLGPDTYDDLACKISFAEVAPQNEGNGIKLLREDIELKEESESLSKDLPVIAMNDDTQSICGLIKLETTGSRTLWMMVSRRLDPITTLVGSSFVRAWLEAVRFHAYLWTIGLAYGDPSLWSIMYDEKRMCAVLSDYDLSTFRENQRSPKTDRTGTIPFMAMGLLNDAYWRGDIARVYRHELEALIWILPFVFLRYQDHKSQPGTLVEHWMTSYYKDCARHKARFSNPELVAGNEQLCQPDYIVHWLLPEYLLLWLNRMGTLLHARHRKNTADGDGDTVATHWPRFVAELKEIAAFPETNSKIGYVADLIDELELDNILDLAQPLTYIPLRF